MLARAVGHVTTMDFHRSAFLVSTLASWAAYLCLFRLLSRTLSDARQAFLSTVAVLVFPFAVHHSMQYTESLFLLCMTACFLSATRKSAAAFVFWAALATLTRANGVFLTFPVALFMLENGAFSPRQYLRLLAFPATLAAYGAWLEHRTGDPFAFSTAMRAWGREFNWPWKTLFSNGADFHQVHSWVAVLALVCLVIMTFRRMRPGFLTLSWIGVVLPLTTGITVSFGRYMSVIFPFGILFAQKHRLYFPIALPLHYLVYYLWLRESPITY
jgi:Gpi18-like mannosyltransferase